MGYVEPTELKFRAREKEERIYLISRVREENNGRREKKAGSSRESLT